MDPLLQKSISEISGIDPQESILSDSQDIISTKRLELLTKIMKISSLLDNLTSPQLDRAYLMAVEDLNYTIPNEYYAFLKSSLSKVKTIQKVISTQEVHKAMSLEALICLVKTNDNQSIYSIWSVDPDDRENIRERLESLNKGNNSKKAQIICLDSKEIKQTEIESSPSTMQSSLASSLFGKSSSSSAPNEAKTKAINAVREKLQNYPLHSDGLINDFGNIRFKDMFEKLLRDPNEATNKKWIRMFKQPISDSWSHPCFQALRSFYRNV